MVDYKYLVELFLGLDHNFLAFFFSLLLDEIYHLLNSLRHLDCTAKEEVERGVGGGGGRQTEI